MAPRPIGRPAYVSTSEASRMLTDLGYPLHARTVARLCDRGEIPFHRMPGGKRRMTTAAVEDFAHRMLDKGDTAE